MPFTTNRIDEALIQKRSNFAYRSSPKPMQALREKGLGPIVVVVGGIIQDDEHDLLKSAGIAHVFGPGASSDEIVERTSEFLLSAEALVAQ